MTDENRLVVDNLRLSYSGVFDVLEFYQTVEEWMRKKGYEKETKKKLEHVLASGKNLEWHIELWKDLYDWARGVITVRALFKNVKEIEMKKGGAKKRLNQGDVLIIFDAWLEMDMEGRWQQKPPYYFLKIFFDKLIYPFWDEKQKIIAPLSNDTYELRKRLKDFFSLYRY